MKLDMFPCFFVDDRKKCWFTYMELFSEKIVSSFYIINSNPFNVFFFEWRKGMLFSISISFLSYAINPIIKMRSNKKMRWSYARRVVAFMENKFTSWYFPFKNCPRDSMSCKLWSAMRAKPPIPEFYSATSPYPTFICFFNSFVEFLNEGFCMRNYTKYEMSALPK